jgi:phosphoribosylamine---glycine ligase
VKVLLIGNGGRENAIAWKIVTSPSFQKDSSKLYCAPGSPGIDHYAESVNIKPDEFAKLIEFVKEKEIDFTVVGPEIPLAEGIVDEFNENGLKIFGPTKSAARIESSKKYAKELMHSHGVPTAKFKTFNKESISEAKEYLSNINYPVVIKADGLAAGKGVIIAQNYDEASETMESFIEENIFGESGWNFVVEEFLTGNEVSLFIITDGVDYVVLPSAQDHKKIFDGDEGKNTGGMGAYSPANIFMNEELLSEVKEVIIDKILYALSEDGSKFKGCLYAGLIIDKYRKPYVIEFNCRFGDPETQAVLPLIKSDFLELLLASVEGRMSKYKLETEEGSCVCVVLASGGYPDEYEKGKVILGLNDTDKDCLVFHAGTKYGHDNNEIITKGGRVLNIVARGKTLQDAVDKAYKNVEKIEFDKMFYRKDIGHRSLN